jgi:hypothetical protein
VPSAFLLSLWEVRRGPIAEGGQDSPPGAGHLRLALASIHHIPRVPAKMPKNSLPAWPSSPSGSSPPGRGRERAGRRRRPRFPTGCWPSSSRPRCYSSHPPRSSKDAQEFPASVAIFAFRFLSLWEVRRGLSSCARGRMRAGLPESSRHTPLCRLPGRLSVPSSASRRLQSSPEAPRAGWSARMSLTHEASDC